MATIRNIIETTFLTKGAGAAASATDNVTKAQTRLGQASASTGRQFSAQASGLGGFVAAYAGAAANVFALQQAFTALQKAAQVENIIKGTQTLALQIGENGNQILASVKQITQGQVTLAESAQNINIALSAGLSSDQIEKLVTVATKASRALGRDLNDSLQRLTRGVAKLEPELLDELGIFTRIDPAVEKYAQSIGKAASALTDFERRQAFAVVAIEEGDRKFGSIDTSSATAQKSLEQLTTTITELAQQFGLFVANVLTPFIDFIKNNSGVALLAFLTVLKLVFGTGLRLVGGFFGRAIDDAGKFANVIATSAAKSKGSIDSIITASKELNAVLDKRAKGTRLQGSGEGAGFREGLSADLANEAARARRRFLDGPEKLTSAQISEDTKTLTKAQQELEKANRGTSAAFNDAKKITDSYTEANKKAGASSKFFTAVSLGLTKTLKGVTTAARFAAGAINGIFAALAIAEIVFALFGAEKGPIAALRDLFIDTSQAAKNLEVGILGLSVAAAGGNAKFTQSLKEAGATDDDLEKLGDTLKDIEKSLLSKAFSSAGAQLRKATAFSPEFLTKEFQTAIEFSQQLADGFRRQGKELEALQYEAVGESLRRFGFSAETAGRITRETGVSAESVGRTFERFGKVTADGTLVFDGFGIAINENGRNLKTLTDTQRETINSLSTFGDAATTAFEALKSGNATVTQLDPLIANLGKRLKEVSDAADFDFFGEFGDVPAIAEARAQLKLFREELEAIKRADAGIKAIRDLFSKDIKELDKALVTGLIDANGNIAKDIATQEANQKAFFKSIIDNGVAARQAIDAIDPNGDDENRQAQLTKFNRQIELSNNLIKGLVASAIQLPKKIEEATRREEARTIQLEGQLAVLGAQANLLEKQGELSLLQARQQASNASREEATKLLETQVSLQETLLDQDKARATATARVTEELEKQAAIQREIANIRASTAAVSAQTGREAGIARAQRGLAAAQAFPGLNTLESIRQKQENIVNLEYQNQLAIIAEKLRVAGFEAETQRIDLRNRIAAQMNERAAKQDELDQLQVILASQKSVADARRAAEIQNITQEQARLEIQKNILRDQTDVELLGIQANKENTRIQQELQKNQFEALKTQVDIFNSYSDTTKILANAITTYAEATGDATGAKRLRSLVDDPEALKQIQIDFNALEKARSRNNELQLRTFDEQTSLAIQREQQARSVLNTQISGQATLKKNVEERQSAEIRNEDIIARNKELALRNELDLIERKIQNSFSEFDLIDENLKAKKTAIEQELQGIKDTRTARLEALERERDVIRNIFNEISDLVQNRLGQGVDDLFQAIRDGTLTIDNLKTGIKDLILDVAQGAAQSIFEGLVLDPVKEQLKGVFGSLVDGITGKDNEQTEALGALQSSNERYAELTVSALQDQSKNLASLFGDVTNVRIVGQVGPVQVTTIGGGLGGGIGGKGLKSSITDIGLDSNLVGNTGATVQDLGDSFRSAEVDSGLFFDSIDSGNNAIQDFEGATFDSSTALSGLSGTSQSLQGIFGSLGNVATLAGGALGGLLGGVLGGGPVGSAVGSIAGSLLTSVITSFFSSGGLVGSSGAIARMANGGPVRHFAGGGLQRDSVPALLEPGEFVLRKSAVDSMGVPAAEMLNATGRSGPSDIKVQVTNEGQPKDVSQTDTQFDAKSAIVKIVLKDLSTNGPIRKSIRSQT